MSEVWETLLSCESPPPGGWAPGEEGSDASNGSPSPGLDDSLKTCSGQFLCSRAVSGHSDPALSSPEPPDRPLPLLFGVPLGGSRWSGRSESRQDLLFYPSLKLIPSGPCLEPGPVNRGSLGSQASLTMCWGESDGVVWPENRQPSLPLSSGHTMAAPWYESLAVARHKLFFPILSERLLSGTSYAVPKRI